MSSKTKTTIAKEEAKPALVPKLRFPEFRGANGWRNKTLGEVTVKTDKRNKGGKSFPVYSISNKTGFTPQSEQFEGVDSEKRGYDIALYKLIESNTFAYNPARINVGSIGYSGNLNNVIISSLYVCFKAKPGAVDLFLQHFFETSGFEKSVNNHVEGGIRSYLFYENFARIPISLPSSAEQQKIADCLSSVDQLIATQARKVDALKAHKKGLMQQLFPREGETQPRLRFPESKNAGEWEPHELGPKASKVGSGITPTGGDKNYKSSGRPFVRSQNVGWGVLLLDDVAYIDEETHASFDSTEIKTRDVLLNITGASIGRSAVADERIAGGNVNQHVCIIRAKPDELDPFFLNQFLISQRGQKQIDNFQAGGNRQGLNFAQIRSFAVPLPPKPVEQQRIAECLSSLDALITAETQKHEALKAHKKGLMQQLFPSPEKGEA